MTKFEELTNNFLDQITGFLPGILGAIAVLIIGSIIARIFRSVTEKALNKTSLDNRLFKNSTSGISIEKFLAKLVYYLIMLFVLLIVLEMLGFNNVLDPLKDMVGKFMAFIPNILVAGIIAFAGYMIATIVSEFVSLAAGPITRFSERMGFSTDMDLPKLAKQLIFIIVFIPLLIAALDALNMAAITDPLKSMLNTFILAIPKILLAGIIITVFYIGGKYVSNMLGDLLSNMGTDRLSEKLNLTGIVGNTSLSKMISSLVFFFIVFTGTITAVEKLEFTQLSGILNNLLELSAQIFFGLIIMAIGNYIASIAYDSMSKTEDGKFMASLARIAILGLFLAIALRTMGIANDIVNLAFGLTLGAVAVAIALSFGLGGREAAGKQMEHILKNFRKEK